MTDNRRPHRYNGGSSPWSSEQRLEAVTKAEELMDDGRSANQAAKEVGAEYRVSHSTVQRWAREFDRPLSQRIQNAASARAEGAREARRQYTGADYRRAANDLMSLTQAALAEVLEAKKKLGGARGLLPEIGRLELSLNRALVRERQLIELGFGLDPDGGRGAGESDGEEGDDGNLIDWEQRVAAAREARRRMESEG